MFVAPGHVLSSGDFPKPQTLIHQELYEHVLHRKLTLGMLARGFPGAVTRSIRFRLGMR